MKRKLALLASCLPGSLIVICASPAPAKFLRAPEVPVERLLKNVAAHVRENPKDAQGYYLLGRINALAFDRKTDRLRASEKGLGTPGKLPWLDPWQGQPKPAEKSLTEERLKKHLLDSIKNYRKAIELKPGQGIFYLGLAWILERGATYAGTIGLPPGQKLPATKPAGEQLKKVKALIAQLGHKEYRVREAAHWKLRALVPVAGPALLEHKDHKDGEVRSRVGRLLGGCWREEAIWHYLRAYQLTIKADRKIKHRPMRGLSSLVSYEAGNAWVRLVKGRGLKPAEQKTLAQVEKDLKALDAKQPHAITPIVFSLKPHAGLADLLAEDKTVSFDLDGTGRPQRWQWVKPTTGILVWDPTDRGKITSGRQLLGSVTWWMFWPDGYHALNALDDNRDGQLTGAELEGLAVWFDRDTDGVCDGGEVVTLSSLGAAALATRATGTTGGAPFNAAGLRLRSGRALPTYDWIARRGQSRPARRTHH